MAGIYIHIPFCTSKCVYCDFYSVVSGSLLSDYVYSLCKEIKSRGENYIDLLDEEDRVINTIYFGGGTPSVLTSSDVAKILGTIFQVFNVSSDVEITFELNPDKIDSTYVEALKQNGINRISIGVQSFNDKILKFLGRRHSVQDALNVIKYCREADIENISLDLIYGIPNQSMEDFKRDLKTVIDLGVPHLSAYHLIYENQTPLFYKLTKGEITPISDSCSVSMMEWLFSYTAQNRLIPYEISAFSHDGYESKHNMSYWLGEPYIGFGPSSHSYIHPRRWNIKPQLKRYCNNPLDENLVSIETITLEEEFEEYLLTRLRTLRKGISLNYIRERFGQKKYEKVRSKVEKGLKQGHLKTLFSGNIVLTYKGLIIMDSILLDLIE